MALKGARRVIGIDIRENVLAVARQQARAAGVVHKTCHFATTEELSDIVVSIDAFEHFSKPAKILSLMSTLLRPEGGLSLFWADLVSPFGWGIYSPFFPGPI